MAHISSFIITHYSSLDVMHLTCCTKFDTYKIYAKYMQNMTTTMIGRSLCFNVEFFVLRVCKSKCWLVTCLYVIFLSQCLFDLFWSLSPLICWYLSSIHFHSPQKETHTPSDMIYFFTDVRTQDKYKRVCRWIFDLFALHCYVATANKVCVAFT